MIKIHVVDSNAVVNNLHVRDCRPAGEVPTLEDFHKWGNDNNLRLQSDCNVYGCYYVDDRNGDSYMPI